jgi:hypothetical protein
VVVVDGEKTETTDLLGIRGQLDRSGNVLLGAIVNRDTSTRKKFFGRRERYGYYTEAPQLPPPNGKRSRAADKPAELADL